MEDTTPASRQLVYDIVMSKAVEDRFLMCAALYDDAKALASIGMPGGLTEAEQEAYIFKRIHGEYPEEFVSTKWLKIVYSGFWDFPFAFAVEFEGDVYQFRRGYFDEDLDDYPSEYEVRRLDSVSMSSIRENFPCYEGGEVVGQVDMRAVRFDPSHREWIDARVFESLGSKNS